MENTGDSWAPPFAATRNSQRSCPRHSRGRGRLVRPLHLPRPEHSKDARPSQIQLRLDRNVKA